jgi:hypothetical protein
MSARPDEADFGRRQEATTRRIEVKYVEEERRRLRSKDASMVRDDPSGRAEKAASAAGRRALLLNTRPSTQFESPRHCLPAVAGPVIDSAILGSWQLTHFSCSPQIPFPPHHRPRFTRPIRQPGHYQTFGVLFGRKCVILRTNDGQNAQISAADLHRWIVGICDLRPLRESGVREGLVLVNAMHITASVFINDDERGLHQDYEPWLERSGPARAGRNTSTTAPAKTTPTRT